VVRPSGEPACTIGFEHFTVSVDRGARQRMSIRVTNVYRHTDAGWKARAPPRRLPAARQRTP
jgi:hypothetical protein